MYSTKSNTWHVVDLLTGEESHWTCRKEDLFRMTSTVLRKHDVPHVLYGYAAVRKSISETGHITHTRRKMTAWNGFEYYRDEIAFVVVENQNHERLTGDDVINAFLNNTEKEEYQYRRGPVPHVFKRSFRGYCRPISYKHTLMAAEDDQCREYGIKPVREKTRIEKWVLEPVRTGSKSWKDNTKCRKQWQKHQN